MPQVYINNFKKQLCRKIVKSLRQLPFYDVLWKYSLASLNFSLGSLKKVVCCEKEIAESRQNETDVQIFFIDRPLTVAKITLNIFELFWL